MCASQEKGLCCVFLKQVPSSQQQNKIKGSCAARQQGSYTRLERAVRAVQLKRQLAAWRRLCIRTDCKGKGYVCIAPYSPMSKVLS